MRVQQGAGGQRGEGRGEAVTDAEHPPDGAVPGGHAGPLQAALDVVDRGADEARDDQPRDSSGAAEVDRQQRSDHAGERGADDLRAPPSAVGRFARGSGGRSSAGQQGDQRREHAGSQYDEDEGAGEQVVGAAEGRGTGGRKGECEHVSPGSAEVHRNRTCPGSSSHPAPVLKTGGRTSAPSTSAAEHSGKPGAPGRRRLSPLRQRRGPRCRRSPCTWWARRPCHRGSGTRIRRPRGRRCC